MTAPARPTLTARDRAAFAAARDRARHDAARILDRLWSRGEPDAPLPVSPGTIAERLGIRVGHGTLEPGVAVLLLKQPDEDAAIYVSKDDSPNRWRFAVAHALGHFVNPGRDPREFAFVDERGTLAVPSDDPEGAYANEFAAHLVIPPRELRLFARGFTEVELAWRFDVTREAMRYRLTGAGLEVP